MMSSFKKHIATVSSLFTFLYLSVPHVYAQPKINPWTDPNGDGNKNDSCLVNDVPTLKCLEVVTSNLLVMMNALVLLVLFVMFVIGSFKYLTSLGQPDKIEEAKKTFTWAIIGLVVYSSAYIILFVIDQLFLGGQGQIFRLNIGGP